MGRIAALDLGSTSFLLTVADVTPHGLAELHDESHVTRLSEGLSQSGCISDAAARRSLDVLTRFRDMLQAWDVDAVYAVGTAVFRKARNADAFRNQAEQTLGVPIVVISGEQEAELSFRSVADDPVFSADRLTVGDIGGGSFELASRGECAGSLVRVSVPLGAVRLSERHLLSDPITPAQRCELTREVESVLVNSAVPIQPLCVGVGGTFVNLASLHLGLGHVAHEAVHGVTLTCDAVGRMADRLAALSTGERAAIAEMEPERAPIIHAGALTLAGFMRIYNIPEVRVSRRGIRWGVLYEHAAAHRS